MPVRCFLENSYISNLNEHNASSINLTWRTKSMAKIEKHLILQTLKHLHFSENAQIMYISEILSAKITQFWLKSEILSLKTRFLTRFWPWQRIWLHRVVDEGRETARHETRDLLKPKPSPVSRVPKSRVNKHNNSTIKQLNNQQLKIGDQNHVSN